MQTKECNKCNNFLDVELFGSYYRKDRQKIFVPPICKNCRNKEKRIKRNSPRKKFFLDETHKECSRCNSIFLHEEFGNSKTLNSKCRPCRKEYDREWHTNNREKRKKKKIDRWDAHNISRQQYLDLLNKYNGLCWICKEKNGQAIDHDHSCCPKPTSCGKCVRGILCFSCNVMLGSAKDNAQVLKNAIEYLNDGH
jgi:hypothetical protein